MIETGIIRRIDSLGRVTLPVELRTSLGIKEGDPLEIFTQHGQIILRKHNDKAIAIARALDALREIIGDKTPGRRELLYKANYIEGVAMRLIKAEEDED